MNPKYVLLCFQSPAGLQEADADRCTCSGCWRQEPPGRHRPIPAQNDDSFPAALAARQPTWPQRTLHLSGFCWRLQGAWISDVRTDVLQLVEGEPSLLYSAQTPGKIFLILSSVSLRLPSQPLWLSCSTHRENTSGLRGLPAAPSLDCKRSLIRKDDGKLWVCSFKSQLQCSTGRDFRSQRSLSEPGRTVRNISLRDFTAGRNLSQQPFLCICGL